MIRTISSRVSSDFKRLTKYKNQRHARVILTSLKVCDKPIMRVRDALP
jgi:hypothetical protein